jgi:hypothetical protein
MAEFIEEMILPEEDVKRNIERERNLLFEVYKSDYLRDSQRSQKVVQNFEELEF